jgi:hypothetical protein
VLCGKFPSETLLSKYGLQEEYSRILNAIKFGDIGTYEAALNAQQPQLIKKGMLIMMENLRLIAYRNLFKRVWVALNNVHQIKLDFFKRALEL